MLVLTALRCGAGSINIEATEAAEAVQADVAALTSDANNHFLVVLLWFVPVSLALLAAVWFAASRNGA